MIYICIFPISVIPNICDYPNMSTPGGTPHHSDAEEEPKEEGRLKFEDANMENVHVRTKRMIAAQKRRETTTTD